MSQHKHFLSSTNLCLLIVDRGLLVFQTLCLRQNLITKIENLEHNVLLTELDLYDNQITKIENLDTLVDLE